MTVEDLARVCHSANVAYCKAIGETHQREWDELEPHHHRAIIAGVKMHLSNPKASPADSHNEWFNFKMNEGWSYGPKIDADKMTHPCMVPFKELPKAQAAKDHLFKAICNSLGGFVRRNEPTEE